MAKEHVIEAPIEVILDGLLKLTLNVGWVTKVERDLDNGAWCNIHLLEQKLILDLEG